MKKLTMPELNTLRLKGNIEEGIAFYKRIIPKKILDETNFIGLIENELKDISKELDEFDINQVFRQEVSEIELFNFSNNYAFLIECESYEQLNDIYIKISDGGQIIQELTPINKNGWVKDKFNLTWEMKVEDNHED